MNHLNSQRSTRSALTLSALLFLWAKAGLVIFLGNANAQDVYNGTYEVVENGPSCQGQHDTQLRVNLNAQNVQGFLWPTDAGRRQGCYRTERRGLEVQRIEVPCSDRQLSENETYQHHQKFGRDFSINGSFDVCMRLWSVELLDANFAISGTFEEESVSLKLPEIGSGISDGEPNIWAERWEAHRSILGMDSVNSVPGLTLNVECIALPKPDEIDQQAFAVINLNLALLESESEACGKKCFSQVIDDERSPEFSAGFFFRKCLGPDANAQVREVDQ